MEKVINYLKEILKYNDTIVVACSGGPDSMCLLDILVGLKDELYLNIICAHVNHKYRKESDLEQVEVKKYCDTHNIIFEVYTIIDYQDDKFTESEARDKRYNFFEDLQNKYNAKYIMTAHHGDDLIETILMRITRGSNLKGYIGFKKENNYYIRPLIEVTKKDILNYCHQHNLWYAIDQSNNSLEHTRNRFRLKVLPFLKEEDENVHNKFLKFSKELIDYDNFVNDYLDKKAPLIIDDNTLNLPLLLKENDFIIRKLLERVISIIQIDYKFNISDSQLYEIIKMIKSSKVNSQINLSDSFLAIKDYDKLIIKKSIEKKDYEYPLYSSQTIDNYGIIEYVTNDAEISNYVIRINSSQIKLPIIVRNRRKGDKIIVKNLNGTKKIKDIFIDEKIPIEKRSNYPIVVDSNNSILWIPGIKKSHFDKNKDEKYDIIIRYEEEKYEAK